MKSKQLSIVSLIIMTLFLMGFTTQSNKKDPNARPLVNTHWVLKDSKAGVGEEKPFIYFESDGKFHGYAGCNRYFGTYFHNKKKIDLDYTGATRRLCHDMEMEDTFFSNFRRELSHYKITGDTLYLMEKKKVLLVFVAEEPTNLEGTPKN